MHVTRNRLVKRVARTHAAGSFGVGADLARHLVGAMTNNPDLFPTYKLTAPLEHQK